MRANPFMELNSMLGPGGERWVPVHCVVPLSRGAALFAALSLGHTTLERIGALDLVARTFTPDPGAMRAYEPLYREFTGLYKQQKSMYARLNGTP